MTSNANIDEASEPPKTPDQVVQSTSEPAKQIWEKANITTSPGRPVVRARRSTRFASSDGRDPGIDASSDADISEKEQERGTKKGGEDVNGLAPILSAAPTQADDAAPASASRPVSSRRPRAATLSSGFSAGTLSLPPLKRKETRLAQKQANPLEHLGITLGLPMILLFDLIIPIIIYYTWRAKHPHEDFDKDILGYAIICFGFGELWILLARVYRLFRHPEDCAPLLSRSKWELDATSWVYAVAMIMALIPFTVGSSLELPHLYLYGPSFIMGFLGLLMIVTLIPFKIPIGINSQPRGTRLRPFIYYAAEDFIAVDGLQDREFRVRYNDRYETNKMFRRFFLYLTLWWLLGVCVYEGAVSAIIWTLDFPTAFGLSFGVLFAYIATWAATTFFFTKWEIRREHRIFEETLNDV